MTSTPSNTPSNPHVAALLAALRATPDNAPLQGLVVDACCEHRDAAALLEGYALCGPSLFDDTDRRARALRLLADAGEHAALARIAPSGSAEALMAQARLFFAEGRRAEAQEAYLAAVAANPAIEDAAFASQLSV